MSPYRLRLRRQPSFSTSVCFAWAAAPAQHPLVLQRVVSAGDQRVCGYMPLQTTKMLVGKWMDIRWTSWEERFKQGRRIVTGPNLRKCLARLIQAAITEEQLQEDERREARASIGIVNGHLPG